MKNLKEEIRKVFDDELEHPSLDGKGVHRTNIEKVFDESIILFKIVRDNPEGYPELVKEFYTQHLNRKEVYPDGKPVPFEHMKVECFNYGATWRDFLFEKLLEAN